MWPVVLFLLLVDYSQGEQSENECYQNVQSELEKAFTSYHVPRDATKVLNEYRNVKNFTENVKGIKFDLGIIEDLIDKNVQDLNKKKIQYEANLDKNKNNIDECRNLMITFKNMLKKIQTFNNTYGDIKKKLDASIQKSIDIQQAFDAVRIPNYVGNNYVCSTNITDVLQKMKVIVGLTKNNLKKLKDQKLNNLKKINADTRNMLESIDKLDDIEVPLKIDKETEPTLEKISKQIEDLKKRLKNLNTYEFQLSERLDNYIDILKRRRDVREQYESIRNLTRTVCLKNLCQISKIQFEP